MGRASAGQFSMTGLANRGCERSERLSKVWLLGLDSCREPRAKRVGRSLTTAREPTFASLKLAPRAGFEPATLRLTVSLTRSCTDADRGSLSNKYGPDLRFPRWAHVTPHHAEFDVGWAQIWAQFQTDASALLADDKSESPCNRLTSERDGIPGG